MTTTEKLLALHGDSNSIFDIGVFLEENEQLEYAKLVYSIAASLKNTMAMTRLADLVWKSKNVEDIEFSKSLYLMAAKLGDDVGYYNLAIMCKIVGDMESHKKYMKLSEDGGLSS